MAIPVQTKTLDLIAMIPTTKGNLAIYQISENAVTIEFGVAIDDALLLRINAFDQLLKKSPFPGMRSTVPGYATLSIFFDPLQVLNNEGLPGKTCYQKVSNYLQGLKEDEKAASIVAADIIEIPVCYGGDFGPDLTYVADFHHMTTDEVIRLHTSAIYTVYMIGFIPGFAYLGGLSDELETPRKESPRKVVPAGSVGIAGKQTGVYPLDTPGGWQLIGKTPLKLFDAAREQPSLLKAGDQVKFGAINYGDYETLINK